MIDVQASGREWIVQRDGRLVSAHPSAAEAERAGDWLRAHDGEPTDEGMLQCHRTTTGDSDAVLSGT